MRARWLRVVGIASALAVCAAFYGHYYTRLVGEYSSTTRLAVDFDSPKRIWDGTPDLPHPAHREERSREHKQKLKVKTQIKTTLAPTCAASLRQQVQKDSFFGKLFNFEGPLLMYDTHMTENNWNTLSKRSVPYGWKDLSREDVASTLKLLNSSANRDVFERKDPQKCVRCAVVGNGGILNGSRKGKEIDGHDYVFRINGAITKGFEIDVGTKTSFYGFTVNTMRNSLIAYNEYGFTQTPQGQNLSYIFIPSDLRDYVMLRSAILGVRVPTGFDKDELPFKYFGPDTSSKKFKLLHPEFLQYTRDRFLKSDILKSEYANLYMPSTGGLMLLTALHSCDQVSAYGFITPNYNQFSDHYYEKKKKPLEFYANHDMILEMQLWGELHEKGILKLYKR
ncbi:hypothetical protein GDO86_013824 [Hymenochirus boettgeri]|uniref:alpha-N-acetylgalactosaminide alpha-2,6-sialyltransferase n=1 Tax=Hymenochirus boettgeri TaxID=247094 RepID=A0A8T2JLN4_9PIPI|nr:hypothetical protein GDO86_013824 [Hymenochirus boettgeri]